MPYPAPMQWWCVDDYFDTLRDKMSDNTFARYFEQESELRHARELASIRTQSHALKWSGTDEELTATITKWYEAGWIEADSLPDALRRASSHFVTPGGTPVITLLATMPQSNPGEPPSSNPRQAFIVPLLEKKGWSILDWANEASVSHATTQDYLANKTKSFRSTRLKLARALGISIEQLPR
jgi:lambda repressor-like predicted transcriptional regulator